MLDKIYPAQSLAGIYRIILSKKGIELLSSQRSLPPYLLAKARMGTVNEKCRLKSDKQQTGTA